MAKRKQKNTSIWLLPVFVILIAAQSFASVIFILSLTKLNILQNWQHWAIIGVLAFFLILNAFVLLVARRGRIFKILCALISIVVTIACAFAFKYVLQTISFVESITENQYETTTYQVRVLKASSYQKIDQLTDKKIGFLTINPNLDDTKNALRNTIEFKDADYDEIGTMILGLEEKKIDAVVINQSYLDLLEEAESTFGDDTRSIFEFEVRTEKPDTRENAVDVTIDPFILYISGSDSRGSITERARSDVNILAVVNPRDAKILLVNIPRDTYVYLHGITTVKDKLTHAGLYGINMSKTTIEDFLDIKINYTVKVGFETVLRVVDEIDGIEIDSPKAYSTTECYFKEGKQTVNSTCALVFARTRKIYTAGGDRQRGKNQQQMLASIIQKVSDPHYLTRYNKILKAAEGTFETSLTYDEITGFVRHQLNDMRHWSIESIQTDGKGAMLPTYSWGSTHKLWCIVPDQDSVDAAKAKIAEYLK